MTPAPARIGRLPESGSESRDACGLCGASALRRAGGRREPRGILECAECGIRFLPAPDGLAPEGTRGAPRVSEPVLSRKRWARRLRLLAEVPGGRLLDVSCGDGVFLEMARNRGFQILGSEPCRHASARTAQWLNAPVYCGELPELDLPPEFVDVVTAWNTLDRTSRPGAYLRAIRSVLAPGGAALVAVADRGGARRRVASAATGSPCRLPLWDAASLRRALELHGLAVRAIRTDPGSARGLPFTIARFRTSPARGALPRALLAIARATETPP